jgi:Flp pilus assembly protein TadB
MWWLLIPVIGAVVAAVAGSDDEEKEAAERRARMQASEAREAEAQAIARQQKADLKKRQTQLVADAKGQLTDFFSAHAAVVVLAEEAPMHITFGTLQAVAANKVPTKATPMLKLLNIVAPGAVFSPVWTAKAVEAHALEKEIKGLKRLKVELLG